MNAGAAPKLITSARLSSCPPKSVVCRAKRASRPSTASKTMAAKIRYAATLKLCCEKKTVNQSVLWVSAVSVQTYIAPNPQTAFPNVARLGRK